MDDPIRIRLLNDGKTYSPREPIIAGIPLARGEVLDIEELQLTDKDGLVIPAYFSTASRWSDGSIKWMHVYFQAVVGDTKRDQLFICENINRSASEIDGPQVNKFMVEANDDNVIVNTGKADFVIKKKSLGPFSQVFVNDIKQLASCGSQLMMRDFKGEELKTEVKSIDLGDMSNPLQLTLSLKGNFVESNDELFAEFVLRMTFFANLATVKIDLSVLNPRAAEHPKGAWDLGDKGSMLFSDLTQEIFFPDDVENTSLRVKLEFGSEWKSIDSKRYCLYQDSSGGDNWQSNNHVNATDDIPVKFRGYKSLENGIETDNGLRANPQFRLRSSSANISAYIKNFWQNFPKAMEVEQGKLQLKLFPDQFRDPFELQGGEQKTHTFYLDFSDDTEALSWCNSPRYVKLDREYVEGTRVLPFFPRRYCEDDLQTLISRGLAGEHNFFQKREVIDEFGWRNFGDIYADHEELNYTGSTPLISHYNNQYDPLDGFLRQYLTSGDKRWFELAAPLAQHIVDIDTYKTDEDRDEYNGGLFWHTDHYANAFSATHRTYSIKNSTSYDGEAGGGPGKEHCYTTGLVNFYFLTGDPVYKNSALELVKWMQCSFEGSGTVLERIWQFFSRDISIFKQLVSGNTVQKHIYPFNRATGNYITALIDAYGLTDDSIYIQQVEDVISQSMHPEDNISLRCLDDIEKNWSYLVLLQAVCKYLALRAANEELDRSFYYARDCLLHYANWILINESPFLNSSNKLDFPNLTWVAQDLRKACVLQVASCFSTENKQELLAKSAEFRDYVSTRLKNGENNQYTRILVILMQNYLEEDLAIVLPFEGQVSGHIFTDYGQPPLYSLRAILIDFVCDFLKRMRCLALSRELRWLKFRFKAF